MKAGWEEKPLGDVCDILDRLRKPITKSDREAGPYPYYGATGVLDHVADYIFDEPLVLMGEDGAKWEAGANSAFPVSGKVWVNNHAHVIRPHRDRVSDEWLIYFLNASDLMPFVSGMTVPKLNQGRLREIPIPLPPLEEQHRIVAVLDEAFEGLSRARAHAETNLQNARELFENFLTGLMASRSSEWTTYSFGDGSVLQIVDGDRGANYPTKSDFMTDGHCLFLNTKNVRPDGFDFGETMFVSQERDQLLRKGKLKPRDVILTTRGTIGNIAIYDETVPYEHIRINSGMLVLRPNEERVRSEFLFELLRSSVIKSQIAEHVSGAAQPQLPIRSLVKFDLPAPKSTYEQLRIVEKLKLLREETSRLSDSYSRSIQSLDTLRQSLLQKAFAGELTG